MILPPLKYRHLPSWREVVLVIITAIAVTVAMGVLSAHGAVATGAIFVAEGELFSAVGIGRMLISAAITGCVAYFVWWIQNRSTQKRIAEHKATEEKLESDLKTATEEKERIAEGHTKLLARVGQGEKALSTLTQQLALMEQQARPLFEAAKIRLIESLTHPAEEFKVPDALLKLTLGPEGYITPELAVLLKERETSTHPDVTPEEKLAAAILPTVVELAAIEAKVIGPVTSQLVSSPKQISEE